MTDARPQLRWTCRPPGAEAVALVLHGGAETGDEPNDWRQIPVLRLKPFADALARAGAGHLAVARLLFSVKGWNGERESPMPDALWALDQVRAAYPGRPIGLLGHSMGARVALRLADQPDVAALVTLAAWVEEVDTPHGRPGVSALLVHGTADRITPAFGSRYMAQWMADLGVETRFVALPGEGHALLRHPRRTHRRSATWLAERLVGPN